MKLFSLNAVALALLVLGVSGMIVPTGASPGSDQIWDEPAIKLAPAPGPNGAYADLGPDGELAVDVSGVNTGSVTLIRDVVTVTNTEARQYRLWVSHDADESVSFFVGSTRTIQDPDEPIVLDAGQTRSVSLVIDARDRATEEVLMTQLTLHAEPVVTSTPSPVPTSPPTGQTGPRQTETPPETAAPTPTPLATPSTDVEQSVEVVFAVATGGDPSGAPGTPAVVEVREMALSELDDEDPLATPRAIINHSLSGPVVLGEECPCGQERRLTVRGVDALVGVGQPVTLSSTRSVVGQAGGVDSQRRIIKLVDIVPPEDKRDTPAIVRITVARSKFGGTDPGEAVIAHRTRRGWRVLDTRVMGESASAVTLEARSAGFSPFAVFVSHEISYRWSLPDGTTLEGTQIRSQFDDPGLYNVTLTVIDAYERSDTTTYRILVNDRPAVALEGLEDAVDGEVVTVRANVTNEVGNVTVTWLFADGSTTMGESVTREFEPGETVRVTAEDEFGARGTATGVAGRPALATDRPTVVQYVLGLQSHHAIVGAAVIFCFSGLRWLLKRRRGVLG